MSAAFSGSGWMAELLVACALTLAAAYWLLDVGGGETRAPRGPRDAQSKERSPGGKRSLNGKISVT